MMMHWQQNNGGPDPSIQTTALLVAHQFPLPPIPCSPHAALTLSWTGRTLGIFWRLS